MEEAKSWSSFTLCDSKPRGGHSGVERGKTSLSGTCSLRKDKVRCLYISFIIFHVCVKVLISSAYICGCLILNNHYTWVFVFEQSLYKLEKQETSLSLWLKQHKFKSQKRAEWNWSQVVSQLVPKTLW